jgi:hypothetical protein
MKYPQQHIRSEIAEEPVVRYGFVYQSDEEKLRNDISRPDIEKLQLFTRMLRKNATLAKAVISHIK